MASKLAADTPLLTGQVINVKAVHVGFFLITAAHSDVALFDFSGFLMPFSPQFLVEPVPFLGHLVVEKLSLVKLFLRSACCNSLGAYSMYRIFES